MKQNLLFRFELLNHLSELIRSENADRLSVISWLNMLNNLISSSSGDYLEFGWRIQGSYWEGFV